MPSKYHSILILLSILLKTFSFLNQEKRILVYPYSRYRKLLRKTKKSEKKRKTSLIIPKFLLLLFMATNDFHSNNGKTYNEEIVTDYISLSDTIKNNFMTQQYQLYALSKLKYKNRNNLCRYLLLLSGDIESNPGPGDSCSVCDRKMAVRHKVLCCWQCESWVHKKCADISETHYKSIKNKENGVIFDCGKCHNYAEEMPFFLEEFLEMPQKLCTGITFFSGRIFRMPS